MKISLTGYLLLALALSAVGNAFLSWRLVGAGARCRVSMVEAAKAAIMNERARAAEAEEQASEIATDEKQKGRDAATANEVSTNGRETAIRSVVVHGDCRMPVGLPSLQPAVDEANAAARD